jgi:HSP20 family molecular chaperone IbpA
MPSAKPAFYPKRVANPQLVDQMEGQKIDAELHQRLSERAYVLYEESGRQDGHDQKNWLQAKSEIVRGLEIRTSGTWVALTASMPDASPDNIRVFVDTNRVVVQAEKSADPSGTESSTGDTSMFLAADLDVELDPPTATASFRDQTLNLMVKKQRSVSTTGS